MFSRIKKALKIKRAHKPQPYVPLKCSSISSETPPHLLGAGVKDERVEKNRFWRWRHLHLFGRKGTYDVAKAEKVNQSQAGSVLTLTDDIHEHQEAPSFEVLPALEEHLEQDILQHQDVHAPVSPTEVKNVEELDKSHILWRYELGDMLGEGSFGCVHAGTRCEDGLKVAVKIVDKTPDMHSIRVLGHPRHLPLEIGLTLIANKGPSVPQIIKLLDWQDNPNQYIMVLEQPVPCMSLFDFVKVRERLDEKMAKHVMWQVILAANICCERGVFHRDIKLENLLVNQDTWEVKLIDFGCGELMKDSAYVAFSGTEVFCPPEFYVDGEYHAKPATVWSLGILLFLIVYGYYPNEEDLHRISKNDWFDSDPSQECCQMIHDCLKLDPQQRLILEEMLIHDWFMVVD